MSFIEDITIIAQDRFGWRYRGSNVDHFIISKSIQIVCCGNGSQPSHSQDLWEKINTEHKLWVFNEKKYYYYH